MVYTSRSLNPSSLLQRSCWAKFQNLKTLWANLEAKFHKEDEVLLKHNRSFLSPEVQQADKERDERYMAFHRMLKSLLLSLDNETKTTAEFIWGIVKDYGYLPSKQYDDQSGLMANLVDDLKDKYTQKVNQLGLMQLVLDMEAANNKFISTLADRAYSEGAKTKGAMKQARKDTDEAYRLFTDKVNALATLNLTPELIQFINYANVEIIRLRESIGLNPETPEAGTEDVTTPSEPPTGQDPSEENPPTTNPDEGEQNPNPSNPNPEDPNPESPNPNPENPGNGEGGENNGSNNGENNGGNGENNNTNTPDPDDPWYNPDDEPD